MSARYRWTIERLDSTWLLLVPIGACFAGAVAFARTGDHLRLGRPVMAIGIALFAVAAHATAATDRSWRLAIAAPLALCGAVVVLFWHPFSELFRVGVGIVSFGLGIAALGWPAWKAERSARALPLTQPDHPSK